MDFAELVRRRRSVRKYAARPVEKEKLDLCVEAARLAPSACNGQPWKFIVVDEPAALARLSEAAFGGLYSMTAFAAKAPALVAVVSEKSPLAPAFGNLVQKTSFKLIDVGIAAEHFVLQACDLGLGTCLIGWFDMKKAAAALGVPESRKVELLISVGYPAEEPGPRPRKEISAMSSRNAY